MNADIDLPFVGEEHEGRLIEKVVSKVAPIAEQSFRAFLPDCYVDCLKIALDEKIDIHDRRTQITTILSGEIAEPLARNLNSNCDAPFVPERIEAEVFEKIAEKLVEEMVGTQYPEFFAQTNFFYRVLLTFMQYTHVFRWNGQWVRSTSAWRPRWRSRARRRTTDSKL